MTTVKIDPKNITEETTLAELREQLLLYKVISLRIYPPLDSDEPLCASLHHTTGFHVGYGATEAAAIEEAFVKLRHTLLPDPLKQAIDR